MKLLILSKHTLPFSEQCAFLLSQLSFIYAIYTKNAYFESW